MRPLIEIIGLMEYWSVGKVMAIDVFHYPPLHHPNSSTWIEK